MVPVGVLRSTDNGDSRQPVNNDLSTGNGINALIATVNAYLLPAANDDGVFRSSDNGDQLVQVNNGLTALFVLSFATDASRDIKIGSRNNGLLALYESALAIITNCFRRS